MSCCMPMLFCSIGWHSSALLLHLGVASFRQTASLHNRAAYKMCACLRSVALSVDAHPLCLINAFVSHRPPTSLQRTCCMSTTTTWWRGCCHTAWCWMSQSAAWWWPFGAASVWRTVSQVRPASCIPCSTATEGHGGAQSAGTSSVAVQC